MAKKGTIFTEDISQSFDPRTEGAGGYEAAGALEGRAIATQGQADAIGKTKTQEMLSFLGTQALEAGKGYKLAELEKGIRDITDRTENTETGWRGGKVGDIREKGIQQMSIERQIAGVQAGVSPENAETSLVQLREYNKELENIKIAADQKILSSSEARAQIGSLLRQNIAQMPGLAQEFRKLTGHMTGIADLDTAEVEAGLALPRGGAKTIGGQPEWLFKKQVDFAIKQGFEPGVAANLLTNPETRVQFQSALQSQARQEDAWAMLEKQRRGQEAGSKIQMEAVKGSVGAALGMSMSTAANFAQVALSQNQILVSDIADHTGKLLPNAPQDKVVAATNIVNYAINQVGEAYTNAITNLDKFAVQGVLPSDIADYRKQLVEDRDRITKLFKEQGDLQSGIAMLKVLRTNEGEAMDVGLKRMSVYAKLKEISGGDQVWAAALDPRTAEAFKAQNPELYSRIIETVNGSFAHAGYMLNVATLVGAVRDPNLPPPAGATPEEKKAAAKLTLQQGISHLENAGKAQQAGNQKIILNEGDKNQIKESLSIMPLTQGKEFDTVANAVINGGFENIYGEGSKQAYTLLNSNLSRYFTGATPTGFPQQLSEEIARANEAANGKAGRPGKFEIKPQLDPSTGALTLNYTKDGKKISEFEYTGMYRDNANLNKLVMHVNRAAELQSFILDKLGKPTPSATVLGGMLKEGGGYARPSAVKRGTVADFPRMDMTPERQAVATDIKRDARGTNLEQDIKDLEMALKYAKGDAANILKREYRDLTGKDWTGK